MCGFDELGLRRAREAIDFDSDFVVVGAVCECVVNGFSGTRVRVKEPVRAEA